MLEWPLVGRERELRRIAAAIEGRAAAGIAVVGDAGVGKTRLVAEVARRLSAFDHSSAALIHLAIASHAASVVITGRSAAGEAPTITQLWKDGLVERIELGPLGEQATRSLAGAVLEGPVDPFGGSGFSLIGSPSTGRLEHR